LKNSKNDSSNTCVLCAIKNIFISFEFSDEGTLNPIELRQTLCALYDSTSKFKLGEIDDAVEALYCILDSIHENLKNPKSLPDVCDPPCIVHDLFNISTIQQLKCSHCNITEEPQTTQNLIFFILRSEFETIFKKTKSFGIQFSVWMEISQRNRKSRTKNERKRNKEM